MNGWATEGQRRVRSAQAAMRRHGLDALLVINSTNFLYLSGYQRPELTLARPRYLILPWQGDPILIQHATFPNDRSWVRDIRRYETLSTCPIAQIGSILGELGLARGRIGTELGLEQRIGIPFGQFDELRQAVAPATFEDAADMLWELRRIKSDWELDLMRQACRATGQAYLRTFAGTRGGESEDDVARRFRTEVIRAGGDAPWNFVRSGRSGYSFEEPCDEPLRSGDMVWLDGGCNVGGIWCDFSRAGVLGKPSRQQIEAQLLVRQLTAAAVELARPGVKVADIANFCYERLQHLGIPQAVSLSSSVGRIGHGIGLDVTEPPHVSVHDLTVLEPGMTIAIEPSFSTPFGKFHIEANLAITQGEPEMLSTAPWELSELPDA